MKINLGCGGRLMPGYINVDLRTPKHPEKIKEVFLQANALEIDSFFLANTVDEVYSAHFFEHLTHPEITELLYGIWSILKPGGKLVIITPDFEGIINTFKKKQLEGDFSDVDILHLKVFNMERETLHKTVWYDVVGRYYLTREKLFTIDKIYNVSDIEICFEAYANKQKGRLEEHGKA